MKNKYVMLAATAVLAMSANVAFSAEYMMCKRVGKTSFGQPILGVKNSVAICESDDAKQEKLLNISELGKEGWKVNQMSATSKNDVDTVYFLMSKD